MLKPLGNKILVQPSPEEEKTASGLYVPDTAKKKPTEGTVVAVGRGKYDDGKLVEPEVKAGDVVGDPKICKVSAVGIGMRSHVGIASQMFRTLSEEGINIQMISTSEIKISVVIEDKYMELAVRALHKAFGLDQPA